MTMRSGESYRQSIRDGRALYVEGERVTDPTAHPLLTPSVEWVAETYDRLVAGGRNWVFDPPRSQGELQAKMAFLLEADDTAASTAGCMMLRDLLDAPGVHGGRLVAFLDRVRGEDLRVASAVLDAGDGVRIIRRTPEGVVIAGAKRHVMGASLVHELLVVPPGRISADATERAVAVAVGVDAKGVRIVNVTTAPRARDARHFPLSQRRSMPDCFVVFDDVFVPWDRVFLDGEVEASGRFAEVLGIWERARAAAWMAEEAELVFGLGQTIVEMNGVPNASHILDKLSHMAVWATMCRAGWEAAIANATKTTSGVVVPSDLHVYATLAYGRNQYNEMVGYLHDVSGALVLTCPSVADYENEATHRYMEKYLRTMKGVTGWDRMKMFHLIRDMTADHYGGWAKVVQQSVGGGLHGQRMATLRLYPKDAAKAKARLFARVDERRPDRTTTA